eukprot:1335605-Amorphochlora_amoeboformis.AAC.2
MASKPEQSTCRGLEVGSLSPISIVDEWSWSGCRESFGPARPRYDGVFSGRVIIQPDDLIRYIYNGFRATAIRVAWKDDQARSTV